MESHLGNFGLCIILALTFTAGLADALRAADEPSRAGFLPDQDPASAAPAVELKDTVAGKHPRLLFTAAKIAQLREFFNSDKAALYRDQLLQYLPGCTVPKDRKTSPAWGQEYGLFKLPTVALHYVLTGDKKSLERSTEYLKWLAGIANWTEGGEPAVPDTSEAYAGVLEKMRRLPPADERNSDTTAAFTMVGAALTWDWLYNDLDPAFREQFRKVLWEHARAMYYGGHMAGNPKGYYWNGVPMYNHRWFRDWGLALATLATTEGKPEEQWLLGKVHDELQFMADWLPPDGSIHEGPGYGSSSGALGMAFQASDECTGTRFLEQPYFKNVAMFAMQESQPGMHDAVYFSDCFTHARSIHPFYLKTASCFHQPDELDGIRQYIKASASQFGVREYAWLSLLCDDPAQTGGQYSRLPTTAFFADLGLTIIRDNWTENGASAMFKCGPPGGYKLNAWRPVKQKTDGKFPYINVAHDHPDANTFTLFADGEYLAETNRYPLKPPKETGTTTVWGKVSSAHNTILINGLGQTPQGQPEGMDWYQPSSEDMTKMGVITAWKDAGDVVIAEGEAAGSYLAETDGKSKQSRPALERFRRTFIWVKGSYVLVLDDIRAPQTVDVTWLMQGARLEPVDEEQGRFRLSKNKAECEFQLLADAPFQKRIGVSPANDHGKLLNWQQLQATAHVQNVRFASVYDIWKHKDLKITFTPDGPEKATLTVTGAGISDTWVWAAASENFAASTLHGTRPDKFDLSFDAKTAAPPAN
jgi:hypothetical protein